MSGRLRFKKQNVNFCQCPIDLDDDRVGELTKTCILPCRPHGRLGRAYWHNGKPYYTYSKAPTRLLTHWKTLLYALQGANPIITIITYLTICTPRRQPGHWHNGNLTVRTPGRQPDQWKTLLYARQGTNPVTDIIKNLTMCTPGRQPDY